MDSERLKLLAEIVKGLAWPLVAAIGCGVVFREDIKALMKRLRKGGPAEFDPPSQTQASGVAGDAVAMISHATSRALSTLPATPTTLHWENELRMTEFVKNAATPVEREQVLLRIAARVMTISMFESTEASIFASQLGILDHLNRNREGDALNAIKHRFYDRAVDEYPDAFARYSFSDYLAFLRRNFLVTFDSVTARITDQGIEYLAWRIEQGKPPRTMY